MNVFSQNINFQYYVPRWRDHQRGFTVDLTPSGIIRTGVYSSLTELLGYGSQMKIPIPIDPLTAIGMGVVTPEEIGLPPGLEAAFNLLK